MPYLIFFESDKPDSRFHKFQLTLSGPVYGTYFNHGMRAELQTLLQTFAAVSGQQQCLISLPGAGLQQKPRDVVVVHSVKKSVERGEKNHQLPFAGGIQLPCDVIAAPAHFMNIVENLFADFLFDPGLPVDCPRHGAKPHAASSCNIFDGQISVCRHFLFALIKRMEIFPVYFTIILEAK